MRTTLSQYLFDVGAFIMSGDKRDESTSAGPYFFLVIAMAFLAIAVWNLTTNAIPVGIAFLGLSFIVAVYALDKKRRRDGHK